MTARQHAAVLIVPVVSIVAICVVTWLTGCAETKITPQDTTALASETMQDTACVTENRSDAGAMNACRAANRRSFDAYWAEYFDGGAQ